MLARLYLRLFITAAVVIAADQATKGYALENFGEPQVLGFVTFRLAFNSGGAFGLLQGFPEFFLVATVLAIGLILLWVRHVEDVRWAIPLGLILGGGAGNVIDRVVRDTGGRVVDFIDIGDWPVFNIADSCIVTGVGLMLLFGFRDERNRSDEDERE